MIYYESVNPLTVYCVVRQQVIVLDQDDNCGYKPKIAIQLIAHLHTDGFFFN